MNEGYYVHNLDPVAFSIGEQDISWYWLVYLLSYFYIDFLLRRLTRKSWQEAAQATAAFLPWGWLGLLLGARLGYVFFYNASLYWHDPAEILRLWHGGMSFHGAVLGVAISAWLFSRQRSLPMWDVSDPLALFIPLCLAAGRVANFMNGELAGRVTQVPWAVIFDKPDQQPRHPSQLYEAFAEGLVLQGLMVLLLRSPRRPGQATARFLTAYGALRFIVEFWREPDQQLGFLAAGLSMGQWLCLLTVAVGLIMAYWSKRQEVKPMERAQNAK